MNLTQLKQKLLSRRTLLVLIFLIIIILIIFTISVRKQKEYIITEVPQPVAGQAVKNGKFDVEADSSKKSKEEIDKIKNKLPYREEFTTSTDTKVTFVIFIKPTDPYSLHIETLNINLQISPENSNFPKEILNFRELAARAYGWLKDQNLKLNTTFIVWGEPSLQRASELVLFESPQYPKVVQEGDKWVFEKPSPQPTPQESPNK